ncbi:unnamed protein product, partial [Symbiodinium natans]
MPSFQFELEYAKSARSACKHCKEKIEKDAVRIGMKTVVDMESASAAERAKGHAAESAKWHHEGCFPKIRKSAWFRQHLPEDVESIAGFDALEEADQKRVSAVFTLCKGEAAQEEAAVPQGKRKSGGASGKPSKKAKLAEEEAAPASGPSALTSEQHNSIETAKAELSRKSAAALGCLLQKNGLPKSGRKEELLDRVAEAKVLGVPPVCPTCDKVKLRWSKVTGNYSCPGFFDEEKGHFRKCKADVETCETDLQ